MRTFRLSLPRWTRHPQLDRPTTASSLRVEVCPPSLRQSPDSGWSRLWFWLSAPAPHQAAPPVSLLPTVRADFIRCLSGLQSPQAEALERRIGLARSLRELWHLRAELYRLVSIAYSQSDAERRIGELNRHFPTRAPRSGMAPLAS